MTTTVELARPSEILEPGQATLAELAAVANSEHARVVEAGASMLEHAIATGEALLAVQQRCAPGSWMDWLEANFDGPTAAVKTYMRLATHKEAIMSAVGPEASIRMAVMYLRGESRRWPLEIPADVRAEGLRLIKQGVHDADVAQLIGVSRTTVGRWRDPDAARRYDERQARKRARGRQARLALAQREQSAAVKDAVRRAGAALAECYAMAERMQDVLGQARREAESLEAKRALADAGEHYRNMRDEIVRALGVVDGAAEHRKVTARNAARARWGDRHV